MSPHLVGRACSRPLFYQRRDFGDKMSSVPPLLGRVGKVPIELLPAFFQSLQSELPAMQLDAELIDVAGDLSPLRFVFFELSP